LKTFPFRKLLLCFWVLTLPLTITGAYLAYKALDRFYTFQVRYEGRLRLSNVLSYERDHFIQKIRATFLHQVKGGNTDLPAVQIFVPRANLAQLESHMPQSGFDYIKGSMLQKGELKKIKVKYRGDYLSHWAWEKKSLRIKTNKNSLYEGMRRFNLQAPKRRAQIINFQSLQLAADMDLLGPRAKLVRLYLNGNNRGIYVLIEQLGEITLRNTNLMPGDIYRGEMIAKDGFTGKGQAWYGLFDSPSLWDKVAVNNHYQDSAMAPLETLIGLLRRRADHEAQRQLSQILDMNSWGRFSAYQALVGTKHFTWDHNWRLYYDSWRGKFYPIVWDPVGWQHRSLSTFAVIRTKLFDALFRNGDFLRARNSAFTEFFNSQKPATFLKHLSDTTELMEEEIALDPYLKPGDASSVVDAMRDLETKVAQTFAATKQEWLNGAKPESRFHYKSNTVTLSVGGYRPIQRLRLLFAEAVHQSFSVSISYLVPEGRIFTDATESVEVDGSNIILNAGFLSNHIVNKKAGNRPVAVLQVSPGYYQITFAGLDSDLHLTGLDIDRGNGWIRAQPVDSITPTVFSQLYAPIAVEMVPPPIIWSGQVTIEGHQILDQPLTIEPGTIVRLAPGATVVLKHRLTAKGTPEAPLHFVPVTTGQDPWGAIVLSGRGADGSTLSHCELSDGSGLKGDLFEYSAMLSIHDVKNVVISDCHFRNNHTVDDMVHAVYTDIRFERVRFENALFDALDLDISTASISDSHFEHSGNDAVDLMTTQAVITGSVFRNNGDKGISVGENSRLYAANNKLVGNVVGVQSKDRSTAILLNQTLMDNKIALHAYKKNWRYGEGGAIFLGKSIVGGGEISAAAEKRSAIQIFDSYLEIPAEGKRVDTIAVDDDSSSSALQNDLFPDSDIVDPRLMEQLEGIPADLLKRVAATRRGSLIDG
jgi:hypothetical protein